MRTSGLHAPSARNALLFALAGLSILFFFSDAIAQTAPRRPFGVGEAMPSGAAPPSGLVAYLLAKQAEFTRAMIVATRASLSGGGIWGLLAIAFGYGVFHAAGPGHGKAIVMSYVFANERALQRGVGVALAAALLQALIAIALVVPAVLILGTTARQLDASIAWIEIISFATITALGLSLIVRKFKALRLARASQRLVALSPAPARFGASDPLGFNDPDHVQGPHCAHVHLPQASDMTGEKSWRDLAAATIAAGSRPCSGAILLLAFALSVGAVWAGVAAVFAMAVGTAITTAGFAILAVAAKALSLRAAEKTERLQLITAILELIAAVLITALGLALLAGYLSGA